MQDQDAPPVEEGETGGGVDAVPEAATRMAAPAANNATASTQPRWTTATERRSAVTITAPGQDASGQGFQPIIRSLSQNRCRCAKMQRRRFSVLSTIFSSRQRFRKPRAS